MGNSLAKMEMCCKQPFHGFAKEAAEKESREEKLSTGSRNRNV
jgi:hypothetical protein